MSVRILEVKEDSFDANGHQYQFHGDREFAWEDGTIQTLESVGRTTANFLSLPGCFFFPTLSSSNFLSFTQPAGMLLPGAPTMNALNGVVSGHLKEDPKNLRSEFSGLVKRTRHTLATYVLLTQVDLHSSSGARARHDVDRDRFGAEGVSMLWPTTLEGRKGVRVRTITPG